MLLWKALVDFVHHGIIRRLLLASSLALLTACTTSGVGDPCNPEQVPEGGFAETEIFLETSSVQCRSRVCLVNRFPGGDPNAYTDTDTLGNDCIDADDPGTCLNGVVEDRVHCSCRCAAPAGANTPTCACPNGFTCLENAVTTGGIGIEGGYCVRDDALGAAE